MSLSKRELYHGGEFEGDQCRSLLEHLSFFEDASGNPKIPMMAPFLVTLKAFNEIRKKCYSASGVAPDYRESIKKFRDSYFELNKDFGLSITPTVHDICFHLEMFMEKYPDVLLGLVSEQTPESSHRVWANFIETRMISNQDHPLYATKLKSTFSLFNSKHI